MLAVASAYRKDILCTVRNNLKRFVSIAVICALGVTMFCGLRAACEDLRASADAVYDDQRLFDVQVLSTLGLDDDDVAALAGVEGVAMAEGGYTESTYADVAGERASVDVRALSDSGMNEPYLIEGRLPQASGEVAVTAEFLEASGLAIGDEVEIVDADSADEEVFARRPYTVVGAVIDPMDVNNPDLSFRSTSGSDYAFFVSQDDVTAEAYTVAYLAVDGASGLASYSPAYEERVDAVVSRIEDEVRADREAARTAAVKGEAQEELDEARAEYEEERAEAERELADGLEQIEEGQAEIDANRQTLEESERELEEGWDAYYAGLSELARGRSQARSSFAAAQDEIDANRAKLDRSQAQLDAGMREVEQGEKALAAAERELEQGEQELVGSVNAGMGGLGVSVSSAEEVSAALGELVEPVRELQGKADEAADEVERIEGEIAGIDEELAGLDEVEDADRIAELDRQRAEAEKRLGVAKGALERLQAQLDGVLGMMEAAGASLDDLGAAIVAADGISAGKAEAAAQRKTLAAGRSELEANQGKVDRGYDELEAGQAELDRQRASTYASLDAAAAKLSSARDELEAGEAQLPRAWELIDEAQAELDRARAEWQEGRDEADEQFAEAERELDDAQADIDAIETASWYVQDRSSVSSYASVESDAASIEAIGTLFPAVFLVVAILVVLTTVTRMVEEERGLIGTYKALGYRNREILGKYLAYAVSACAVGCVVGLALGFVALPVFLFSIFDLMYVLPSYPILFDAAYGAASVAIFLVAVVGTAWAACRSEVRQTPAALMRPKAPKAGSRIFLERIPFVWGRLSFLSKVTARNIFRYKQRFLMTVAGIMGCTALIVCGFIIRDSVAQLTPEQYGRIVRYDILAVVDDGELDGVLDELGENGDVAQADPIRIDSVTLKTDEGEEAIQLVAVPDGTRLGDYVELSDAGDGSPVELPQSGAVFTRNAAEVLGFSAGDAVSVQDSALDQADVEVACVAENYLGNYVFMGEAAYEEAFGDLEANGLVALASDACEDEAAFADGLAGDGRFMSVTSTEELEHGFEKSFMLINAVVAIVLGMAAALAFTVLFTLSTTNISERERELATIKVLGFRAGEVHHYVNKETLILTALGIAAGLPCGYVLGDVLLQSLKMPSISFLTTISPVSYAVSAVLPFAFALAVNLITNRTLDRIDMISALKSVE